MMIVGVDPGLTGAIAILSNVEFPDARSALTYTTMQVNDFYKTMSYVQSLGDMHVYIEKAQSFPKGGVAGMFSYGRHFGELLGVLVGLNIPHTLVHPALWTRSMHVGAKAGNPKKRSLEVCRRLFAEANLNVGKSKKPHEGIVDALLIAEWGRRQQLGGMSRAAT